MKIYDFDGMFDEKLSDYIAKNSGKYKEEEREDVIPRLYKKFGETVIKSLGLTPVQFFSRMDDGELLRSLKTYLKNGVPVPEYLCTEIEKRSMTEMLLPLLHGSEGERDYAMTLIGADSRAVDTYLDILTSSGDEEVKNRCVELIKEQADRVSARVLDYYKKGVDKEFMLEILSRTVIPSEEVFTVLLNEFRTDADNIPMHASYLAAYGDERALPYLLDKIDEEGISFIEYQELKFAIEALGGEYTK